MASFPKKHPDGQLPLFESDTLLDRGVVNVASVPQRSVFRYPGGKTWLIPYVRKWLRAQSKRPVELIEPFAGGGSIGLTAVFEHLVDHVTLVERDPQIACVWHTLLNDDAHWLAERIVSFDLNIVNVEEELSRSVNSTREQAFQTILKNRVNRGGIMAAGAGRIKQGENNKGMASRWYPQTLQKRILAIMAMRDHISFIEGDRLDIISQYKSSSDVVFFIDPPYTASGKRAGSRLYTYFNNDHAALFALADQLTSQFLMTYDNTEDIRNRAQQYHFQYEAIAMNNTHHERMNELIITRDLSWRVPQTAHVSQY